MVTTSDPFSSNLHIELTAAQIGIHCDRWKCIPRSQASPERAAVIMAEHRFDVLPITDPGGVSQYFCTEAWGRCSTVVSQLF
jgi:hypothetical protein